MQNRVIPTGGATWCQDNLLGLLVDFSQGAFAAFQPCRSNEVLSDFLSECISMHW